MSKFIVVLVVLFVLVVLLPPVSAFAGFKCVSDGQVHEYLGVHFACCTDGRPIVYDVEDMKAKRLLEDQLAPLCEPVDQCLLPTDAGPLPQRE